MPSNRRRPGKRPRADPAPRAERKKSAPAAARPKPRRPAPAAKAAEAEAQSTPEPQEPLEPEVVEPEAVAAEPEVLPPEGEAETTLPVRVEERDLAHADALQRYMADVARHPLLTREEEHELAVKFRETQDPRIAYRLVTANLRLVVKIAHEYRRAAFNLLDPSRKGTWA